MNRIVLLILLFLLQVVVLNHLDMSIYVYPQVFILILIMLPPYLKKYAQLLIAFGIGLAADLFVSTPGIHASACLSMMLLRFGFLGRYELDEIVANKAWLTRNTMGLEKFVVYTLAMVFFYHFYAFALESVGSLHLMKYLISVGISGTVAYFVILLYQLMFSKT